jgi:hypothetical protein
VTHLLVANVAKKIGTPFLANKQLDQTSLGELMEKKASEQFDRICREEGVTRFTILIGSAFICCCLGAVLIFLHGYSSTLASKHVSLNGTEITLELLTSRGDVHIRASARNKWSLNYMLSERDEGESGAIFLSKNGRVATFKYGAEKLIVDLSNGEVLDSSP